MFRVNVHKGIIQFITIFQCLAFWVDGNETLCSQIVKYFHFLFFTSFVISLGTGAFITEEMEDSVFLLAAFVAVLVHFGSFFHILWRGNEIFRLIYQIGTINFTHHEEYIRVNGTMNNLMKFAKCVLMLSVITFALSFIFYGVEGRKRLFLNIAFPLDWKNSEIGYWVTFSYLVIEIIYCTVIFFLNIIIWFLMHSLTIKYDILGNQLRRMGSSTTGQKISAARKQHLFLQNLIETIKAHQKMQE